MQTLYGMLARRAVPLLLLASGLGASATANEFSASEVEDQCRMTWSSLSTLHFVVNEYNQDGNRLDYERGHNRYEFWQATDGKRAMIVHAVFPDRVELVDDFRQDGRRRYTATAYEGHPETIRDVAIDNQSDSDDRYDGSMNAVLWLLMPAGKPVHVHLVEGAQVVADEDPGEGRVVLMSEHRGQPLRIVVDPDRDWLPVEVSQEGVFRFVATDFEQDNGRWFPVEGRMEHGGRSDIQRSGFEVTEFQINRPIPPERFARPVVETGVAVIDRTGRQPRTEFKGGRESFSQRSQHYTPDWQTQALADPVVVPRSGRSNALLFGLVSLGSVALLVAIGLRFRRSLREE